MRNYAFPYEPTHVGLLIFFWLWLFIFWVN